MASITVKLPETLKDQASEVADKRGYQSTSEYVRAALRDKIEEDLVIVRRHSGDDEFITLEEAKKLETDENASTGST